MDDSSKALPGIHLIIQYIMARVKADGDIDKPTENLVEATFQYFILHPESYDHCSGILYHHLNSVVRLDELQKILSCSASKSPEMSVIDGAHDLPMISGQNHKVSWSPFEDIRLLAAIMHNGTVNWNAISQFVGNNRSRTQCYQRWHRGLNSQVPKERWTDEDDNHLQSLMEKFGDKQWSKVAQAMGDRSDVQCRYRFHQLRHAVSFPIPDFSHISKRKHQVYEKSDIAEVLDFIGSPHLPRGAMATIHRMTGIPVSTLSDWRKTRLEQGNENWFPNINGHPHKRALSDEAEASVYSQLFSDFVSPGVGATRADIKRLSLQQFALLNPCETTEKHFTASSSFVDGFMDRHQLSLRTPRYKRRTTPDEDCIESFLDRVRHVANDYPLYNIYNVDETCWRLYMCPRRVIAEKGSTKVKLLYNKSNKIAITAIGAIRADGTKLPLWVLGKGRSHRCLKKFGDVPGVVFHHSENGWCNEAIAMKYLEHIHSDAEGERCCLIWDVYSSHRSDAVVRKAKELNIELLYVPAGMTSVFQPLDIRIFGELKMRARAAFESLKEKKMSRDLEYNDSIVILRDCWDCISAENIDKAWEVLIHE